MSLESVILAKNVNKRFGNHCALSDIDFSIKSGSIVGLIGPNGAGKTTLLKGILGLAEVSGELSVLGLDPKRQRTQLLQQVSFIADTAIMPRWLRVDQALAYMEAVHVNFHREKALTFLAKTKIALNSRVGQLSKGMVTQLHLALIMAIDSKLLILDEPTLGLDILFRKQFYTSLLNDYYDDEKTILITTHQVEEIEHILTNVMFIDQGKLILDHSNDELQEAYAQLDVNSAVLQQIKQQGLIPLGVQKRLGGASLIFENIPFTQLEQFGAVKTPSIADIFVAKVGDRGETV